MGLDMYLEARKFVGGYSHTSEEERETFNQIVDAVKLGGMHDERFATVNVNVAYWRKANHIHQWFVDNVQGGEDDCKSYHVSREQLLELENLCRKVVMSGTAEVAEELLPTTGGFFFGNEEYDEYYFEQTDWTAKRLAELLTKIPDTAGLGSIEFYYQSSW
jgi:hypothetical protein